jgi:hypothetical protein
VEVAVVVAVVAAVVDTVLVAVEKRHIVNARGQTKTPLMSFSAGAQRPVTISLSHGPDVSYRHPPICSSGHSTSTADVAVDVVVAVLVVNVVGSLPFRPH